MADRIQIRRDTAANWTLVNPVLTSGEIGLESDTRRLKFGDGSSAWSALSYGGYIVSEGDVTAHQAALTITESQISDLGTYQVQLAEGAFVNGDKTKLDGIETGATSDQTGAEIKVAYEAEADTNAYTDSEKAKVGHISITQAVDLDAIETRVNELDASVILKGTWDASAGTFPGSGSAQAGESWIVSVGGTVGGVAFVANDRIVATSDNASTTLYADWHKLDYTDAVLSVAGKTGAVTLVKADITDFNEADYATGAEGDLAATAQQPPAEGAFVNGDKTKLDGIEALADVTDTANVTAAGALMDSEVTNLAAVKSFDAADYATAAQGSTADTAVQPGDDADVLGSGAATDGQVLTADGLGGAAWEDATGGSGGTVDVVSNVTQDRILGRVTTGSGDSEELTPTQVRTLINVEDGATADQTGAEIKTALFAEVDTNNLTDTLLGKLNGIETGADVTDTANVTAAGALMDSEVDADIKTLTLPASTTISAFGASLVDDADAATARTTLGLAIGTDVQAFDADTLKADTHDTLTAGYDSDAEALGTVSSGTTTPEVDADTKENFKTLTANGAFTLAPPSTSSNCTIIIQVTNGASAGTITTSGFTIVNGDTYETTSGNDYLFHIKKVGSFTSLTIEALQ